MRRNRTDPKAYSQQAPIPTLYNGIQFRSRLEATWAAFFDELGWDWEYEPALFEGAGWTPDFLIRKRHLLVEVKPVVSPTGWDRHPAVEYAMRRELPEDLLVLFAGVSPESRWLNRLPYPEDYEGERLEYEGAVDTPWVGRAVIPKFGGRQCEIYLAAEFCLCGGTPNLSGYGFFGHEISAPQTVDADHTLGPFIAGRNWRDCWKKAKNAVQWRPS